MQLKIFSIVGLALALSLTGGLLFAELEDTSNPTKEERKECIQDAKFEKKTTIQDVRDLYKSERERLNRPEYRPALREARANMRFDIRAAKNEYKLTVKDCKEQF